MRTFANQLIALSIVAAWLFDFLFWHQSAGVNYPIFILVLIVSLFVSARLKDINAAPATWALATLAVLFSSVIAVRQEPFTVFLALVIPLAIVPLVAHTFPSGQWPNFGFLQYLIAYFKTFIGSLSSQITHLVALEPKPKEAEGSAGRKSLPFLRGILISIPVLFVFASLLSAADPVFASTLEKIFGWFSFENLPELMFRAFYIGVASYLISGLLFHTASISTSSPRNSSELNSKALRLLGSTESYIVLILVNALLLLFVVIQFQYFFGGESNITSQGFTYAEYARRGFFELVAVAVFGLLLQLGLSRLTRLDTTRQNTAFAALTAVFIGLLMIILISSSQRLALYEAAYGFTRLRTYTHFFTLWLGALLLIVAALQLIKRSDKFALAYVLIAMGFALTLPALNVDAFIVRHNVSRLTLGHSLDISYIAGLSSDMVPELVNLRHQYPEHQREIDAALLCNAARTNSYENENGWRSTNLSRARAHSLLTALQTTGTLLGEVIIEEDTGWQYIEIDGLTIGCSPAFGWD